MRVGWVPIRFSRKDLQDFADFRSVRAPVVAFVDNKLTLPVYRHPVDKAARTGALIHSA